MGALSSSASSTGHAAACPRDFGRPRSTTAFCLGSVIAVHIVRTTTAPSLPHLGIIPISEQLFGSFHSLQRMLHDLAIHNGLAFPSICPLPFPLARDKPEHDCTSCCTPDHFSLTCLLLALFALLQHLICFVDPFRAALLASCTAVDLRRGLRRPYPRSTPNRHGSIFPLGL